MLIGHLYFSLINSPLTTHKQSISPHPPAQIYQDTLLIEHFDLTM
jgi:hypothetical protein